MNQTKKPLFWNKFAIVFGIIASVASSCISYISFPKNWNILIKIIATIGTFILIFIICLLLYNIIYSRLLYKYTNQLEQENKKKESELKLIKEQKQKFAKNIVNQRKLLNEYSFLLQQIILEIETGILSIEKGEIEYLKKLLDVTYKKQEHIYELEGKNERM